MTLLAIGVVLGPGCAMNPIAVTRGTSSLHGQLRLIPHEGAPRAHGTDPAYGDPRFRDVRLLDYARPGFAVVYLESPAPPRQTHRVTIQPSRRGARLDPERIAIGVSSKLVIRNDTSVNHRLSGPDLGLLADLAPGETAEIEPGTAGPFSLFLLGSDDAGQTDEEAREAIVFVAPGPYTVVGRRGNWELGNVRPGRLQVHAWHPRFAPVSRDILAVADRSISVELAMGVGLHGPGRAADAQP